MSLRWWNFLECFWKMALVVAVGQGAYALANWMLSLPWFIVAIAIEAIVIVWVSWGVTDPDADRQI